jgi:hypothetical protein
MNKVVKTVFFSMLVCAFVTLAYGEARAVVVKINDGYIESVDYRAASVHVKLTNRGLLHGTLLQGARQLAKQVQARRPSSMRNWPPINNDKLAGQIQRHCGWYFVSPPWWRSHANPIDVMWTQIT